MAPLNTMSGFLMAALFLAPSFAGAAAAAVAVAVADECNKGCARYEKTDFRQFLECNDFCAFEADYKAMYEGLEACNKACDAGGSSSASSCKDVCAVKVDDVADVIATRACYRDCARGDPGAGAKKACEASCDRRGERGVEFVEKDAVARLDVCFKRCDREEGGEDVRRVNACKEACPLVRFAKEKLHMGK